MNILVGSRAIKNWFPDFPREPKDTDYAVSSNTHITLEKNEGKVEYLYNPVLYKFNKGKICTPDNLYTLKMSHLFWNINWIKHEWDANFLRERGCKLNYPLFYELYEYFNELHGKNKRSDLKMSSADFFDNALRFPIVHDKLHEILITHPYFEGQNKPTYTNILIDEVDVSMKKFADLTEQQKFNIVFEEVAVMGIERFPRSMYYKAVHDKMLKKFILNHCKIEEAIWILENYKKLVCNIPFNFCKFMWEKIDEICESSEILLEKDLVN